MKKKYTAIVLAAGSGSRMNSDVKKQFMLLDEKPLLYYSLKAFQDSIYIEKIILVTGNDSMEYCREGIVNTYGFTKVLAVVEGGQERYDSVYQGLLASEGADYVLIHDGARPFVTDEIIKRCCEGVAAYKACIAGMPSKDTVKLVDEHGIVVSTPLREQVWNVQTPQAFDYSLICDCHHKIREGSMEGITDDGMIVEAASQVKVHLVEGAYENIKITTPEDLVIARGILEKQECK